MNTICSKPSPAQVLLYEKSTANGVLTIISGISPDCVHFEPTDSLAQAAATFASPFVFHETYIFLNSNLPPQVKFIAAILIGMLGICVPVTGSA